MFAYGNFLTVVINFLILAWIIFLMVKAVNNLRRGWSGRSRPHPLRRRRPTSQLLTEIRDLLAKRIAPGRCTCDQNPGCVGGRGFLCSRLRKRAMQRRRLSIGTIA